MNMSALVCSINSSGGKKLVKSMLKTMNPDFKGEEGIVAHNGMVFACVGPTEEAPIESSDGAQIVAFSGSLYNAEKLRPLVKPKPKSGTDSEIVLSLYKMKGRKCVHYLDGSFAFVLADGDSFYAARDHLGTKPLYYARTQKGGWLFASELKAFPEDAIKVAEFPAGCYLDSEAGARRYFKLVEAPAKQVNVPEAVELIRLLVTDAVQKQHQADEEVGIYLTGSLESCIIAALAAEKTKKIKTFSVGLADSDDGHTAKRVASWLSTDHTHYEVTQQDILDNLQHIVRSLESYDAPIVRHAVADFFAVRTASESVRRLTSGDGANEVFGGYAYLRPMFSEKLTNEIRKLTEELHRTNLLRWERMTSVHGVEGRMPFTDRRLITAAFHLPANLKINEEGRSKWILRRAFSTLLPAWVVDRPDSDDTLHHGIQTALQEYAETVFTDDDLAAAKDNDDLPDIRTKDELLYWQIWSNEFPTEYVPLVGRTQF